jgi:sporulation protein YlmC with PRC-barrel domain
MLSLVSTIRWWMVAAVFGVFFGRASLQASTNVSPLFRVSQLMRMTVENRDGLELGQIRDVLVDSNRGTVRAFLIGPEGFLAARKPFRVVPPKLLSAATAKRDVIALNVSWKDWSEAPAFEPNNLDAVGRPASIEKMRKHYRSDPSLPGQVGSANPSADLTQTSRESANRTRTILASELLGKTVLGRNREKLGEVVDLLGAMDDHTPAHLLIVPSRSFTGAKHGFALRLRSVDLRDDGKLSVSMDFEELSKSPLYQSHRWLMGELATTSSFRFPMQP